MTPGDWIGRGHIISLMMLSPPELFRRLHELEWYGGMLCRWVDGLGLLPGQNVLELGCGPGLLCRDLAARGLNATGMDRSARMVRAAQRGAAPGQSFRSGSLPALPVEAGAAYDAVLAASLLNVVSDKPAAMAEMARMAIAGGVVSVLFPTPAFRQVAGRLASGLTGFSRAAMLQWGRSGAPLGVEMVKELFSDAGLVDCVVTTALDGGIAVVTGQKEGNRD